MKDPAVADGGYNNDRALINLRSGQAVVQLDRANMVCITLKIARWSSPGLAETAALVYLIVS